MMVAKGMVISPACCYLGVKCRVLRNAVSNELITGSVGGRTKRSPSSSRPPQGCKRVSIRDNR